MCSIVIIIIIISVTRRAPLNKKAEKNSYPPVVMLHRIGCAQLNSELNLYWLRMEASLRQVINCGRRRCNTTIKTSRVVSSSECESGVGASTTMSPRCKRRNVVTSSVDDGGSPRLNISHPFPPITSKREPHQSRGRNNRKWLDKHSGCSHSHSDRYTG